jgi:hypothetical protein
MREQLLDLGRALDELPHRLMPNAGATGRSGTRVTAPAPIRLDVVSLLGRGGIADVLGGWEREWCEWHVGDPTPAERTDGEHLAVLVDEPARCEAWLAERLRWACRRHPAVDEFAADIEQLHADTRAALGTRGPVTLGRCRACAGRLVADDQLAGTARCERCSAEVTPHALPARLAAMRAGVRPSTLTTWHARGWVRRIDGGYDVGDLDAASARSRRTRRPLRPPREQPSGDRPHVLAGTLDGQRHGG